MRILIIVLLIMTYCYADDLPLSPPKISSTNTNEEENVEEEIEFYDEEIEVQNDSIIYVIDISSSMSINAGQYIDMEGNVFNGTRLQRAKMELIKSVNSLPEYFRFNILAYDCSSRKFSNSTVIANHNNKNAARGWTSSLSPGGGTGTGMAVSLALSDRNNFTIILLSDGSPNCGYNYVDHQNMIRSNNYQNAKINVFGIDTSSYTRMFLVNVANSNNGIYVDIN